ncbi:hypothetical protein IKF63_02970 [Candidatus Saccharibacteria bacterium]|nr:hypothetical protein [Candidatus Saccharibacteria bacterium]
MMSGYLTWSSRTLFVRGTNGCFWASTLFSYTRPRNLGFGSTNVSSNSNGDKPHGFSIRCVARFKISQKFHPCSTSIEFRRFAPRSKFLNSYVLLTIYS